MVRVNLSLASAGSSRKTGTGTNLADIHEKQEESPMGRYLSFLVLERTLGTLGKHGGTILRLAGFPPKNEEKLFSKENTKFKIASFEVKKEQNLCEGKRQVFLYPL